MSRQLAYNVCAKNCRWLHWCAHARKCDSTCHTSITHDKLQDFSVKFWLCKVSASVILAGSLCHARYIPFMTIVIQSRITKEPFGYPVIRPKLNIFSADGIHFGHSLAGGLQICRRQRGRSYFHVNVSRMTNTFVDWNGRTRGASKQGWKDVWANIQA